MGKPTALVVGSRILLERTPEAELLVKAGYGAEQKDGSIELLPCELLFLVERKKVTAQDGRKKKLDLHILLTKFTRKDKKIWEKYCVFSELSERGYIVKTALKFGADFRAYDRGVKPGQDHARWIVYAVKEGERMTWYDFSSKNRVAHSTKKKLLIGVVDDEGDVSFWESRWIRP